MKNYLLYLTAVLAIALIGCGQQSTAPDNTAEPVTDFSSMPAEAQKLVDQYIGPEDEIPPDVVFNALGPGEDYIGYDVFSVTFIWGDIFGGSSDIAVTDWSGGLQVNGRGHVRVGYEIDFEAGEDYILPVVSVDQVRWVSFTAYDFDGISFLVYLPPITTSDARLSITFATRPFTLTLTHDQLFRYAAFHRVDESRGVVVHSRVIWHNTCPGGTMFGRWIRETNDHNRGIFRGQWIDHAGEPIGLMSGRFWTNEDGSRQFSGNVSGINTDQVLAEFKGMWTYDVSHVSAVNVDGHGYFRGEYRYVDGSNRGGYLKGIFGDDNVSLDQDTLRYHGVWRDRCPHIVLDVPNSSRD